MKTDLSARAKELGLKSTGAKFDILDRIAGFLDTGKVPTVQRAKSRSRFDWHCETLDDDTVLTDSYKNTQNVRRYFKSRLGEGFKFNIAFMAWMKANAGKTLGEACAEYQRIKAREADPDHRTRIKPHNQFNQYTRDFLDDNPNLGMDDVRRVWRLKTAQPSETGRHVYDNSDLDLT